MTEILKPTRENIERSAKLILNDEIVAIPTETVYGLGANGLSDIAVSKIFKAKNRPQDNPLILHISDYDMMENLVYELNDEIKEEIIRQGDEISISNEELSVSIPYR